MIVRGISKDFLGQAREGVAREIWEEGHVRREWGNSGGVRGYVWLLTVIC